MFSIVLSDFYSGLFQHLETILYHHPTTLNIMRTAVETLIQNSSETSISSHGVSLGRNSGTVCL